MTRPAQPRRSNPTPAKTPELCVQIRPKIAATAKIKHAESCLTPHNLPNTPPGHNPPTILQEARVIGNFRGTFRKDRISCYRTVSEMDCDTHQDAPPACRIA